MISEVCEKRIRNSRSCRNACRMLCISFSMFQTGVNLIYKFSIPDGRFALSGLISGIHHP